MKNVSSLGYIEQHRKHIESLSASLKAAAHPDRLKIVELLEGNSVSVGGLHDQLELAYPVISHHLAYLRRAGIVGCERRGTTILYRLIDARLLPLIKAV